jgi:2-polyprenyl-3-methyl-5-hydroxy-6-metoxy-1,4-benzoquinol methylase
MNTDMSKVEAFAGQVVADIAAAFSGVMTNIGHKLGLYKALAGAGWMTSNQLTDKTGTDERYVRESLLRPGYEAHLASGWIASLEGVSEKLETGARVADVGCGHGASTTVMAQVFPNATFVGFDYHDESIATARRSATDAGMGERIRFEAASAKGYGERGFDLICFMDCLHDMGDPVGAARHARQALKDDGTLLLVEPAAGDGVEENINPVSRLYCDTSTAVCTLG